MHRNKRNSTIVRDAEEKRPPRVWQLNCTSQNEISLLPVASYQRYFMPLWLEKWSGLMDHDISAQIARLHCWYLLTLSARPLLYGSRFRSRGQSRTENKYQQKPKLSLGTLIALILFFALTRRISKALNNFYTQALLPLPTNLMALNVWTALNQTSGKSSEAA